MRQCCRRPQGAGWLHLQPLGRHRTDFALLGPAPLLRRPGGGGGFGRGALRRLNGGGIAADMADELGTGMGFDHVFVHFLGQRGEELALEVVEKGAKVRHVLLTSHPASRSNKPHKFQTNPGSERTS